VPYVPLLRHVEQQALLHFLHDVLPVNLRLQQVQFGIISGCYLLNFQRVAASTKIDQTMNDDDDQRSSQVAKYKLFITQRYQVLLDTLTPKLLLRWVIAAFLFLVSGLSDVFYTLSDNRYWSFLITCKIVSSADCVGFVVVVVVGLFRIEIG
jgi:hypothetical protein